jgi:hypothetical protein
MGVWVGVSVWVGGCECVGETYIGKPFRTRVVPQFTKEVAKPLTQ